MERQSIALTAHDTKKEELIDLIKAHKDELQDTVLVATRSTGQLVQSRTGLPVTLVESRRNGGDIQLAALVVSGEIGAVIFLHDALMPQPTEPGVDVMLRACNIHNVPLATNRSTAEILLSTPGVKNDWHEIHQPIADYLDEIAGLHD